MRSFGCCGISSALLCTSNPSTKKELFVEIKNAIEQNEVIPDISEEHQRQLQSCALTTGKRELVALMRAEEFQEYNNCNPYQLQVVTYSVKQE
mmetsp:Transcript_10111/g.15477  ORF Transcript_10111/g.15477 Transcript_10111/m.15477 type:complete len:93 (+) Transcript_10111:150-428(+)